VLPSLAGMRAVVGSDEDEEEGGRSNDDRGVWPATIPHRERTLEALRGGLPPAIMESTVLVARGGVQIRDPEHIRYRIHLRLSVIFMQGCALLCYS
jgi:hypothetical protein